jgi:hypothetical protein
MADFRGDNSYEAFKVATLIEVMDHKCTIGQAGN